MDYSLLLEPAILSEVLVLGLERGAMYALMASGLSLIFGIMGVKNFSHGELFMLGGYVMFYVTMVLDLPCPIGVAAAALLLLVVGMLIARPSIETPRRRAGRDWLPHASLITIT